MRIFYIFFICSTLFYSCVTPRKTHLLQKPDSIIPSYSETTSLSDYKVQFNDELNIVVMTLNPESRAIFNPQKSGGVGGPTSSGKITAVAVKGLYTYTVYDDGTIDFPYIGSVYVEGKTTREIKLTIEERLADYVKDCSVDVNLVNSYVSLLTNTSGSRVLLTKENTNIFEVLSQSGELGDYTKRSEVQIIRNINNTTMVQSFDLRSQDIVHSDFYHVQPNDVIYIKDFDGQFFRLNNFLTVLSTTTTTLSFGFFVWKIIDLWVPKK